MTIFPERDIDFHLFCLMIADDLEGGDPDDLSTDTCLVLYLEFPDCLIFSSCLSVHSLELFGLFDHFFCNESEFSSLVGEHIGLVFVGLDLFVES